MDSKDLSSKKINNEQQRNEGFSGDNLAQNYNPTKLNREVETDADGNQNVVQRARNTDGIPNNDEPPTNPNWNKNENLNHSTSEETMRRNSENKDRNSDVTANRYPNAHPDNHIDRGNMKTDE